MPWYDEVSEEALPPKVREWDEVKNAESAEKFWDQMENMRSHLGRSIRIPSEDAGSEDWEKFNQKLISKVPTLIPKPNPDDPKAMENLHKAMGRPDSEDAYQIPDGAEIDEKNAAALRKIAHAAGLNQAQFANLVKKSAENITEQRQQLTEQQEAEVNQLKTDWGAAYDENYKAVTRFLEDTGAPQNIIDAAKNKRLTASDAKWILNQRKAMQGEGSGAAGDQSSGDMMTPDEARMQISEIMNNREHAYWKQHDPGHATAIDRMVKLQKLANVTG